MNYPILGERNYTFLTANLEVAAPFVLLPVVFSFPESRSSRSWVVSFTFLFYIFSLLLLLELLGVQLPLVGLGAVNVIINDFHMYWSHNQIPNTHLQRSGDELTICSDLCSSSQICEVWEAGVPTRLQNNLWICIPLPAWCCAVHNNLVPGDECAMEIYQTQPKLKSNFCADSLFSGRMRILTHSLFFLN